MIDPREDVRSAECPPDPFSDWLLSLSEDVLTVGISYGELQHPMIALTVAIILLIAIVIFASVIVRLVRRRFRCVHAASRVRSG